MGLWQQSVVKCADNCGIFKAVIIGMPKWHHSRGRVGYAFRMAVRDKSREYRGEKLPRGIIVRTKQPIKRKDGSTIKFDENAFIAISNNKPLGNKVKGPVTYECGHSEHGAMDFLEYVVMSKQFPRKGLRVALMASASQPTYPEISLSVVLLVWFSFFRLKISMTSQDNVVRFGGVPEHFNAPFQRLLQRQAKLDSSACAPQLAWRTYPGGSGAMLKAVISKEVDCACVLTESAVAHIIKNSGKDARDQVRILGTYVASPLVWGVHTSSKRPTDSEGNVFGISRFGSGSHIMAKVDKDKVDGDLAFKVVNSLDGAVESMAKGDIDYFMWEVFTTKHLVDKGEWKLVRRVPAPWPAFVFVVSEDISSDRLEAVKTVVHAVHEEIERMLGDRDETRDFISELYNMSSDDTASWMKDVKWQCNTEVDKSALLLAQDTLCDCGIVDERAKIQPDDLIVTGSCVLAES